MKIAAKLLNCEINPGCYNCTEAIWDSDTDGFTCGERIDSLITEGVIESEACRQISEKFPGECVNVLSS